MKKSKLYKKLEDLIGWLPYLESYGETTNEEEVEVAVSFQLRKFSCAVEEVQSMKDHLVKQDLLTVKELLQSNECNGKCDKCTFCMKQKIHSILSRVTMDNYYLNANEEGKYIVYNLPESRQGYYLHLFVDGHSHHSEESVVSSSESYYLHVDKFIEGIDDYLKTF